MISIDKIIEDVLTSIEPPLSEERINFNVANLGSLPNEILDNVKKFEKYFQTPKALYSLRDFLIPKILQEVNILHPNQEFSLHYTNGSTFNLNLLLICLSNYFKRKLNILCSKHEHEGVTIPCSNLGNCFFYKNDFEKKIIEIKSKKIKIDIFIISYHSYIDGKKSNINEAKKILNYYYPDCLIILDLAQSFSSKNIDFKDVDICFSSSHKWLCGRNGTGFIWISDKTEEAFKNLFKFYGSQSVNNDMGVPGSSDFLGVLENYIALKIRNSKSIGFGSLSKKFIDSQVIPISLCNDSFYTIPTTKIKDPYSTYLQILNDGLDIKYLAEYSLYRITIPYLLDQRSIDKGCDILRKNLG
tara:strand:+ start:3221 stop:4291 length:1071 start_codon:yes stop_codon:yes gene_type:complete